MRTEIPSVKFLNFWPGFDKRDNFITQTLEGSLFEGEIRVHSVFVSFQQQFRQRFARALHFTEPRRSDPRVLIRNIWFTGENIRPPISESFDSYISFDQDSYGGRNTYFPLFYIDLLLGMKESIQRRGVSPLNPECLMDRREPNKQDKKFVCAFLSNPEPTRLRAIEELRKFGEVDVFGPYVGRPVKNKYELAKNYKFCLGFENGLFPGYLTEKLLDSYVCGTVPLYWGDLGRESHINRSSYINAADFTSIEEFASHVGHLDSRDYDQIFSEPLMKSLPSLLSLKLALLGH
jgi:hypothetical protein